jgi:hypothetical protein
MVMSAILVRKHFIMLRSIPRLTTPSGGIISSILHGSKVAKQETKDTFSKLLARGKYVHEMQQHWIKPECIDDYTKLVAAHYPSMAAQDPANMKLCGSWMTEIGDMDTAVHIWEYTGYSGHAASRLRLRQDVQYLEFEKRVRPMLRKRKNLTMLEFAFWATAAPHDRGGCFELRTYELKPGRMLEWETNWRRGLECRQQFCEPVGAWFSQLGDLNVVNHMWQYPDLETRKRTREEAWKVDGWAETVYNTVRLVHSMQAQIMYPLAFSPLK